MDNRRALVERSIPLLNEVRNMTAGTDAETWLNRKYGPDSSLYKDLSALVRAGVEEGWAANVEIQRRKYRRSVIAAPSEETFFFSITAVWMDSAGNRQGNPEDSFRGDYHSHPYGEFNMVVPMNEGAALAGPNGWCHGGWTAPPPASHHYPEAKGGAVIALFFLPAGRIACDIEPPPNASATRTARSRRS
jgi:hypothetical protein